MVLPHAPHARAPQVRGGGLMLRVGGDGTVGARSSAPSIRQGSFAAALRDGGAPALVEDVWALDPATYAPYRTMRERGVRAAVNVPIDVGERRIGSLHVNHRSPGFYGPADLALAGALAAQAGAAVERAWLEAERLDAFRQLAAQGEELALREAEASALRQLDRFKDELLSTVSHELRTPLTVIRGYAHRLRVRGHSLDAGAIEATAGSILDSTSQLTRLVDDLLDFAQLERGRAAVHPEQLDVAPVLEDAVARFRANAGGERLTCDAPEGATVYADPTRFAQIVSNLIENAVKYAPHGPISVRARAQADGSLRVEVADSGPGIDRSEHQRVWEKFYRGAGVAELNVARGAGIGLAVVKELVESHGGRVGLESAPGRGARFWVDLPASAATDPVGAPQSTAPGAGT